MILWIILFLIIVAISFILAFQSMRDFVEKPGNFEEYSLFLIRHPEGFDYQTLEMLHNVFIKGSYILSLEKLFKGQRSALVIFGPKKLLLTLMQPLNLLELEDYAGSLDQFNAWEMGIKKSGQGTGNREKEIFNNIPSLREDEQLWWQISLQPKVTEGKNKFLGQVRVVVTSPDLNRFKQLSSDLQTMGEFIKIPKSLTSAQILKMYKERSLQSGVPHLGTFSAQELVDIVK